MGRKKLPDFMVHKKLGDYSIEQGLIDYVDAMAKELETTGSEMFSRIVRFYMEENNSGTILKEKQKKAELAKEEYDRAKATHNEREKTAHRRADALATKFYAGAFKDVSKRDYVYFEMAAKTGLTPDECLEILNGAGKKNADSIIESAREAASESGLGKA